LIVILDYDMGNVYSIQNMLKRIGEKAVISRDPDTVANADKLILPGVGNYDTGMEQLRKFDLVRQIQNHANNNKPILGICLGMQLLGRKSEEGTTQGLGLIPFDVVKFKFNKSITDGALLKIPHMGWNYTHTEFSDPLTEGIDNSQRYYFVHSYHAICDNFMNTLMTCEYGYTFTAAVKKSNIYGVQFHPEKSHVIGMNLLRNFAQKV